MAGRLRSSAAPNSLDEILRRRGVTQVFLAGISTSAGVESTGRSAYVVNELGNTVVVYDYDPATGLLAERQSVSVLPAGYQGEASAAEVAIHPNGRFLYASCRGCDTLSAASRRL